MYVQLVFNPASGHFDATQVTRLRDEFVRAGAQVVLTESSPTVAYRVDRAADRVCVIGGDGTLRHVLAGLQAEGADIPLAQYACGTVNLFQMEVRWPKPPAEFVAAVLDDRTHNAYDAHLADTRFAVCASVGPDSAAVARLSLRLKRWFGQLAYVVAFLQVLVAWPRPKLTLRWPGGTCDCEAVFIAKGRHYAGPWTFAPAAQLNAPLLHVLAVPHLTRWRFLRFMLALLMGRDPASDTSLRAFTCESLAIDSAAPVDVQADGDIVATAPCSLAVVTTPYRIAR